MKAARKEDPTLTWFSRADLRAYEGKHVAIVDRRVAASGKHPERVFAQARQLFPGKEVIKEDMLLL